MKSKPIFTTWQWVTIVGGLCVAGISMTAWAFSTFPQKLDIEKRLERIEAKLDRVLEFK